MPAVGMGKAGKNMQSKTGYRKTVVSVVIAVLLFVLSIGYLGFEFYLDRVVLFQDLTVELGTQSVGIREFMTSKFSPVRIHWVSDPTKVDLGKVGAHRITLGYGDRSQTVTLTVQDTVAPAVVMDPTREVSVSGIPEAKELVREVRDEAPVRIYYAQKPTIPRDYSDLDVTVVVEDESGNETRNVCRFHFTWMRESVTLELGESLLPEDILLAPQQDSARLDLEELKALSAAAPGTYTLEADGAVCTVTVCDTVAPVLELRDVQRKPGSRIDLEDFVKKAEDVSGTVALRYVGEEPDGKARGTYPVTIEAEDASGNITRKDAVLWITNDAVPPVIQGVKNSFTVEKHGSLDFLEGVVAYDSMDGRCDVTVDTSSLDVDTAGIYYITFNAVDKSGNVGSLKRKVEVLHDEEDTLAWIAEIADTLPDDPEKVRDYVRETIRYSTSWGGDDPVWYGLTNSTGNCYVHALTLQALLDAKGYETQLIWVRNKTHYWLVINLGEVWRHIDSTPSSQHKKISLMTDEQRLAQLNGRDWDFELWPACE